MFIKSRKFSFPFFFVVIIVCAYMLGYGYDFLNFYALLLHNYMLNSFSQNLSVRFVKFVCMRL